MKYYLSIFFIFLAAFGCTVKEPQLPSDVSYKITKMVVDGDRYLVNVEINKILDKKIVKEISDYIKTTNTEVENMKIMFDLNVPHLGSWCLVEYTPVYKLNMNGLNEAEDKILNEASVVDIKHSLQIGKWKELTTSVERTIILYEKNNEKYVRSYYKDKSFGDEKLKLKDKKYIVINDKIDEWYIVEKNKNLGVYSSKGKFTEAIFLEH